MKHFILFTTKLNNMCDDIKDKRECVLNNQCKLTAGQCTSTTLTLDEVQEIIVSAFTELHAITNINPITIHTLINSTRLLGEIKNAMEYLPDDDTIDYEELQMLITDMDHKVNELVDTYSKESNVKDWINESLNLLDQNDREWVQLIQSREHVDYDKLIKDIDEVLPPDENLHKYPKYIVLYTTLSITSGGYGGNSTTFSMFRTDKIIDEIPLIPSRIGQAISTPVTDEDILIINKVTSLQNNRANLRFNAQFLSGMRNNDHTDLYNTLEQITNSVLIHTLTTQRSNGTNNTSEFAVLVFDTEAQVNNPILNTSKVLNRYYKYQKFNLQEYKETPIR